MDVTTFHLVLAGTAAALVGLAKTGVPGIGMFVVVLMAMAFPDQPKQSVGILLPLLIAGDVVAITYYHRHAQWKKLWGLFPAVIVGMIAARFFLSWISNDVFRVALGSLILVLIGLEFLRRRLGWGAIPQNPAVTVGTGFAAGFATTAGNAAGPIMSVYFLSKGLPKQEFIGTAAWFFFLVNVSKVPIFWQLGMITPATLVFDAKLVLLVLAGAFAGIKLLPYIPQKSFDVLVLALSALAAIRLLLP